MTLAKHPLHAPPPLPPAREPSAQGGRWLIFPDRPAGSAPVPSGGRQSLRSLRLARLQASPDQPTRSDAPDEPAGQGLGRVDHLAQAEASVVAVDEIPPPPLDAEPACLAAPEVDPPAPANAADAGGDLASSNLVAASAVAGGSSMVGGGAPWVGLAGLGLAAGGGGGGGAGRAGGGTTSPPPGAANPVNALSSRLATDSGRVNDIAAGGLTRDSTLGLSGTVVSGGQVDVYDGEVLLGSASVSGANWSFLTPALADGIHTLRVRFASAQGAVSFETVTVEVDTQTSGTLSPAVLTDAGAAPSITDGGSTLDRTLGLSGTAEAGSTVQIFDGAKLLGSLSVGSAGTSWAYTTPVLAPGPHRLSARIIDAAGNEFSTEAVQVHVLAGFSIDIEYLGDAARYAPQIQQAAAFWSSAITGDIPDYRGVDDLSIRVSVADLNGNGPVLTAGQALVTGVRPGSLLPYSADIDIDSRLPSTYAADGRLYELMRHEIGHALGFGLFFRELGLLDPNNLFRYTGAHALAQYRKLTQSNASFIALEDAGGAGTAGSHWKESLFDAELMTGILEAKGVAMPVSALTLGVLQDLGYLVDYGLAEAYVLPASVPQRIETQAVILA